MTRCASVPSASSTASRLRSSTPTPTETSVTSYQHGGRNLMSTTSKAESKTGWRRLRSMTEEEVHAAIIDDPDAAPTDEAFWKMRAWSCRRPSDDLRRPLFAARGKLCPSADLRPRRSGFCAAARPAPSSPDVTPPPAASCPSTPMAAASPTCIRACTAGTIAGERAQMRGIAPAQIPGAKISVSHGVGGMTAPSLKKAVLLTN
jgi:hypothetical protein